MITEEEAKTKWCPMARSITATVASNGKGGAIANHKETARPHNRLDDPETGNWAAHTNCIGSACMMWRWHVQTHERVNSTWTDDSWWRPVGEDADKEPPEPRGYCGLAGQP